MYTTGRRAQAPPGGHSTISFGTDDGPLSPRKHTAVAEVAVVEVEATVDEEPVDDGPSLEALKLQAIGAVSAAQDSASAKEALSLLIKQLGILAAERAEPAALEAAAASAAAVVTAECYSSSVAALKAALKLRGTHGIISIGKRFRSMDDDGDRKLTYDEFKKALLEMKLGLGEADMSRLFRHFDSDASGYVSFDELLVGLRGQLNERRLGMVQRCFKVLDKTGDGSVTMADLEHRYDASRHPDVIAGTKTARVVLMEFLGVFEAAGGGTKGDGSVDFEEFKTYYGMVGANIDEGESGDDYFELMMRNVWHVSGGEGWCANTTCKRVLVVFEDDQQKVVELTDDFDVDVKDLTTVRAKLVEQGLTNIKSVALYGDMSSGDSASTLAAAAPLPPSPRAAAGSFAQSPDASLRPSTGRRNPQHNSSSIVFG